MTTMTTYLSNNSTMTLKAGSSEAEVKKAFEIAAECIKPMCRSCKIPAKRRWDQIRVCTISRLIREGTKDRSAVL